VGVGSQGHSPAALPTGDQGRSGRSRKISHFPHRDSIPGTPEASRYTDWTVPAHEFWRYRVQFPHARSPLVTKGFGDFISFDFPPFLSGFPQSGIKNIVSWALPFTSLPFHYVVYTVAKTVYTFVASGYRAMSFHFLDIWMWSFVRGMSVSDCTVAKLKLLKLLWIQITPLWRPTHCYCTTKSNPRLRSPPPLPSIPSEALQNGYGITALREYIQLNITITL
jgi:hypothetical protein